MKRLDIADNYDIEFQLHNDNVYCNVSYFIDGKYQTREFEFVKLVDIETKKYWNNNRYIDNLSKIKATGKTIPIFLMNYDDDGNKCDIANCQHYRIIDGIHRCFVAIQLEYTHIPAIIYGFTTDVPPPCDINAMRVGIVEEMIDCSHINVVKQLRLNKFNTLSTQCTCDTFIWNITDDVSINFAFNEDKLNISSNGINLDDMNTGSHNVVLHSTLLR